jgi:hypothetical protein
VFVELVMADFEAGAVTVRTLHEINDPAFDGLGHAETRHVKPMTVSDNTISRKPYKYQG